MFDLLDREQKGSSLVGLVDRRIVMVSKLNLVGQGEEMCPASLVRTYVLPAYRSLDDGDHCLRDFMMILRSYRT